MTSWIVGSDIVNSPRLDVFDVIVLGHRPAGRHPDTCLACLLGGRQDEPAGRRQFPTEFDVDSAIDIISDDLKPRLVKGRSSYDRAAIRVQRAQFIGVSVGHDVDLERTALAVYANPGSPRRIGFEVPVQRVRDEDPRAKRPGPDMN